LYRLLIGTSASIENRNLTKVEFVISLICLPASPLTFLNFPIFAWRVFAFRSCTFSRVLLVLIFSIYFLLPDPNSSRSNISIMLQNLHQNFVFAIEQPRNFFSVSGENFPISPARLMEYGTLLFLALSMIYFVFTYIKSKANFSLILLATVTFMIFFTGFASNKLSMANRYWFPSILVGTLLFFMCLGRYRKLFLTPLLLITILLNIFVHTYRMDGIGYHIYEFKRLILGHGENIVLNSKSRLLANRFPTQIGEDNNIALGKYDITYSDCSFSHPKVYLFRVYCSSSQGYVYYSPH